MKRLLFICTGNHYRSRLAEILFNHYTRVERGEWIAESWGLLATSSVKGLSPLIARYLKERSLIVSTEVFRDPMTFSVDDLPLFDLVILLNQSEHFPEFEKRFRALSQSLLESGKLRMWNVYDAPLKTNWFLRTIGWQKERASQPEKSATEHIDLAVRMLVAELLSKTPHA